ncbi:hypothetical protein [Neorhizobium galegae]|uniref:hypothetical protein n=1 Tax=Neorhizobium galegae TaxID=399 RepID=UPI0012D4115B|nr:hypothetical protein [Neorhizobium galegae]
MQLIEKFNLLSNFLRLEGIEPVKPDVYSLSGLVMQIGAGEPHLFEDGSGLAFLENLVPLLVGQRHWLAAALRVSVKRSRTVNDAR